jgi:hypothetical protein
LPGCRIVILTHQQQGLPAGNALGRLAFGVWQPAGHTILVQQGLKNPPEADIAILHVDLSVVPEPYLELGRRYPRCLNLGTTDIRKRRVSHDLLSENDDYDGPVLVKTDLNHRGLPERDLALALGGLQARLWEAACRWLPKAWTGRLPTDEESYPMFERRSQVPRWVWRRPELVVERFFVEKHGELYALNQWHFLGSGSIGITVLAPHPIVKFRQQVARFPFHDDIPPEIRRRREELGFDYAKFDYLVTEQGPKLLDANRTPWMEMPVEEPRMATMARGLKAFLD